VTIGRMSFLEVQLILTNTKHHRCARFACYL